MKGGHASWAVAGALLLLGIAPGAAAAGTAGVAGGQVVNTPSPGEANNLVVTVEDDYVRVTESGPGATLTAAPGCMSDGSRRVRCERSSIQRIALMGGDGDDTLANWTVYPAVLDGQAGTDVLFSGGGPDILNGGPGVDTVNYGYRTWPLTVDPDGAADDGFAGEGDTVATDVESIVGGDGIDTLTGGPGANRISGGAGADRLDGGSGADTLEGGAGADTIMSRETNADSVSCGSESDTVVSDPSDTVAADCESVDAQNSTVPVPAPTFAPLPASALGGVDISGQPITITLDGRALVLISCPADRTTACRGTVTIRAAAAQRAGASVRLKNKVTDEDRKTDKNKDTAKGEGTGRVLGKSRYRLQPGQSQKLGVKLSRNGRHRVLRGRRVRCSVNVGLLRAGGKVVSGRKVILKAPKRVAKTVGTKGR